MGELPLITDDPRRGERLARDLGAFHACRVHDLYEPAAPICEIYAVLIDPRPHKLPMPGAKALAILQDMTSKRPRLPRLT